MMPQKLFGGTDFIIPGDYYQVIFTGELFNCLVVVVQLAVHYSSSLKCQCHLYELGQVGRGLRTMGVVGLARNSIKSLEV